MKILIAILVFSIIIIIHELGHFILAKKNGVCVTEFSVGMGPRLISTVKGETRYSIKLLPFGGSCMMLGEDEDVADDERAFGKKSVWARISIIAAGPIFNFALAFLVGCVVVAIAGYVPANVVSVESKSPAYVAGIEEGDVITKIDGHSVDTTDDINLYLQMNPLDGSPIDITYKRDGEKYTTTITPVLKDTYMLGFYYNPGVEPVNIQTITEGYPLYEAGLQIGDVITSVDGTEIATGSELTSYFKENPLTSEAVRIGYERDGVASEVVVNPKYTSTSYDLGATINSYSVKANALEVIKYGAIEVKFVIKSTISGLGMMLSGQLSKDDIAGPVGVVNIIGNTYEASKEYGLTAMVANVGYLLVLISANLGVMNLLPVPALDGGRLVFLFLEVIRGGKKIPSEKEGLIHMIGLVALMALMVFVMFNDISNLFK